MLLPHEIVASFYTFESVNLFGRLTGPPGDPWLQMVFQTYSHFWCQATSTVIGQIDHFSCMLQAMARFWESEKGTEWYRKHPVFEVGSCGISLCFFLSGHPEKICLLMPAWQHPRWNGLIMLSRCVCLEMVVSLKVAFINYFEYKQNMVFRKKESKYPFSTLVPRKTEIRDYLTAVAVVRGHICNYGHTDFDSWIRICLWLFN